MNRRTCSAIAFFLVVSNGAVLAEQGARRALLVAYTESTDTLSKTQSPAQNDVLAVGAILEARFSFSRENVTYVSGNPNEDELLSHFRKVFIDSASKGDRGFFFLSTSGRSPLPISSALFSSAFTGNLAKLFEESSAKGVLIFSFVDAAPAEIDGVEALGRAPLFVRASQESEPHYLSRLDGTLHGAFTRALIKTLRTASSHETGDSVVNRLAMFLWGDGKEQTPLVLGSRRDERLLDDGAVDDWGSLRISISKDMGNGDFEIAAGSVLGLNEGAILTVRQGDKRYETELRVSRVVDPFRSVVTSMGTASKVTLLIDQPVDMELVSWPPPSEANLRVWLGPSTPSEELTRAVQTANEFADWVTDQLEDSTYAVFWTGDAWVLRSASGEVLDASEDLRSIFNLASKHSASKQPFIYFNFPPSEELTRTLEIGPGSENSAVELESDLALANYRLLGRMSDGRIEYAWRRTTVESAKELRSPLPEQSVWVSWQEKDTKDAARKLQDFLSRAGKLRAWLQMESPPPDHPYELTLVRASGESMSEPELYDGEVFGLHVKVRDDSPKRPVSGTWLYVIVIDSYGNGSLLYPSLEGRRGFADIRPTSLDDITLPGLYRVTGPFGIDTYVLVSSSEELPDPQVLSFQGNLTRGSSPRTPLGDILSTVGSPQRVQHRDAPPDWSLQHLFVRTKPNQK